MNEKKLSIYNQKYILNSLDLNKLNLSNYIQIFLIIFTFT